MKDKKNEVWLDGAIIRFADRSSELQLSNLGAIGEYTTDLGPFTDDHFLVLIDRSGAWYEISFGLSCAGKLVSDLCAALDAELSFELANSTDLDSRLQWPSSLQGRKIFDFLEDIPSGNFWYWVKKTLGIAGCVRLKIRDEVMTVLTLGCESAGSHDVESQLTGE